MHLCSISYVGRMSVYYYYYMILYMYNKYRISQFIVNFFKNCMLRQYIHNMYSASMQMIISKPAHRTDIKVGDFIPEGHIQFRRSGICLPS